MEMKHCVLNLKEKKGRGNTFVITIEVLSGHVRHKFCFIVTEQAALTSESHTANINEDCIYPWKDDGILELKHIKLGFWGECAIFLEV